jgi:hypothetical protein
MKKIKNELVIANRRLQKINEELQTLPAGRLSKKGTRYYQVINQDVVGITKNDTLIRQLARKKYLSVVKKELEKNIKTLSTPINKTHTTSFKETVSRLPTTYQNMPAENFYHSAVAQWIEKPYRQNAYRPEDRKYESKSGVKVRSKSELIIANLLEDYQIPYRYEPEMVLDGKGICPDFVIRNPFTNEQFIWEHFGALHLPEYEKKMNDKMERYFAEGLIPFETVIYTFEFDINAKRLKNMIENIIL